MHRLLASSLLITSLTTTLLGCEADGHEMVVDLRTDLVPGEEFAGVRTTVRLESALVDSNDTVATFADDFVDGVRILSSGDLAAGTYRIEVDLLTAAGVPIARRTVSAVLTTSTGVTVLISRDSTRCAPSSCTANQTCGIGESCVDERCTPETPETCPPAACADNGDCAPRADCAIPICVSGSCLYAGQAGSCGSDEWCNPDEGCIPRGSTPTDGGMPDMGMPDTGCPAGTADCDGDMSNGCEMPVSDDVRNCGGCGVRCSDVPQGTAACVMGACSASCESDFADCNDDVSDGCEVDTRDDAANCGVCGSACPTSDPICIASDCVANPFPSDGSEGAFEPTSDTTLSAGVHNFTTITIPAGVTVRTDTTGVLELYATGDVLVEGTIDLSGGDGGTSLRDIGGAGGGETGTTIDGAVLMGTACATAAGGGTAGIGGDGAGLCGAGGRSGGGAAGGSTTRGSGGGGGGGGRAGGGGGSRASLAGGAGGSEPGRSVGGVAGPSTPGGGGEPGMPPYSGNGATCAVLSLCGGGGGSIGAFAAADLAVASSFWPGSGGGGGSGTTDSSAVIAGSGGGGGGGALRVASNTSIRFALSSSVLARGGDGGDMHAGGGGGSGGVIYLSAPTLSLEGIVDSGGGTGGNTSFGDGGNGGLGRIRLSVLPTQCTATGTFDPPLMSGCTPTEMAGATFVAEFPN